MTTPLLDRIARNRPQPEPVRFGNRRPVWLRRMDEQGLPAKDYTNGQFVPAGSERGA